MRRSGPRTRDLVVNVGLHLLDLRDNRSGRLGESVPLQAMGFVR